MEPLIGIVVVAGAAAAIWYFVVRPTRSGRSEPGSRTPTANPVPTPPGGVPLTPDLQALKPGDALSFWDGTDVVVRGSMDCRETLGERTTEWRWMFLSGDRLLELMRQGQVLYDSFAVAHQGDEFYELLVGPGGALKRFEGNVREGIAHEPVLVEIDGMDYRVRSTGTFAATQIGQLPEDPEVWADASSNASDNVYFKLVPAGGSDDKDLALGIWTSHILIARGRAVDRSEITGVFAARAER